MTATVPDVGCKEIALTRGRFALVDCADYEWLSQWKWQASKDPYARRSFRINGRLCQISMHRAIMDAPSGCKVDHINGDTLDNRRANLRLATIAQNRQNSRPSLGKSSRYKGVSLDRQRGTWKASVSLGTFDTEEKAALAYDAAVVAVQGDFAWLNADHFDLGNE